MSSKLSQHKKIVAPTPAYLPASPQADRVLHDEGKKALRRRPSEPIIIDDEEEDDTQLSPPTPGGAAANKKRKVTRSKRADSPLECHIPAEVPHNVAKMLCDYLKANNTTSLPHEVRHRKSLLRTFRL